jgi:hypothetical protein
MIDFEAGKGSHALHFFRHRIRLVQIGAASQ